jgi:uncharacterized membrane protein
LVFWFSFENIYMDVAVQTINLMPCAYSQFVNKNSFSNKYICIHLDVHLTMILWIWNALTYVLSLIILIFFIF